MNSCVRVSQRPGPLSLAHAHLRDVAVGRTPRELRRRARGRARHANVRLLRRRGLEPNRSSAHAMYTIAQLCSDNARRSTATAFVNLYATFINVGDAVLA